MRSRVFVVQAVVIDNAASGFQRFSMVNANRLNISLEPENKGYIVFLAGRENTFCASVDRCTIQLSDGCVRPNFW